MNCSRRRPRFRFFVTLRLTARPPLLSSVVRRVLEGLARVSHLAYLCWCLRLCPLAVRAPRPSSGLPDRLLPAGSPGASRDARRARIPLASALVHAGGNRCRLPFLAAPLVCTQPETRRWLGSSFAVSSCTSMAGNRLEIRYLPALISRQSKQLSRHVSACRCVAAFV